MATVISYGEVADAIVTTARRSPDAEGGDQVLVVFLQDGYTLKQHIGWDALGSLGRHRRLQAISSSLPASAIKLSSGFP